MKIGTLARSVYDGVPAYHEVPVEWHDGPEPPSKFNPMQYDEIFIVVDRNDEFFKVLLSNGSTRWIHRGDVKEVK